MTDQDERVIEIVSDGLLSVFRGRYIEEFSTGELARGAVRALRDAGYTIAAPGTDISHVGGEGGISPDANPPYGGDEK